MEQEIGTIMFECAKCGELTRHRNEDDLCRQCEVMEKQREMENVLNRMRF